MSGYRGGRNQNNRVNRNTQNQPQDKQPQQYHKSNKYPTHSHNQNPQYRKVYRPRRSDRRLNDKISSDIKDQADNLIDKLTNIIDASILDKLPEDKRKEVKDDLQNEKHRFLRVVLGGIYRNINMFINKHPVIVENIDNGTIDVLEKEQQPVSIFKSDEQVASDLKP